MSVSSISDQWISESAVFQELAPQTVWVWRTSGCLALGGQRWRTQEQAGERFYCRAQFEQIRALMGRSPHEPLLVNGRSYLALREAGRRDPVIQRIERRLRRWLQSPDKRCPLLDGQRRLDGEKFSFHAPRGFRGLWMVCEDDLQEIARNLKAGRVIDCVHSPGATKAEAGRLGFSEDVLARLNDPAGRGAVELNGEGLLAWEEYRVSADGDVRACRVFDPDFLHRLRVARSAVAPDVEWLSDREALEKYPGFLRPGDLATWRALAAEDKPCQWLGRIFHARKVPSRWATSDDAGEWRNSAEDLAEIVARMKAAATDDRWTHPLTGKTYLPLRAFRALTGMAEQQVADYRAGKDCLHHIALGGPIAWEQATMPSRRNKWGCNYVYLEEHGQKIAAWKRAGRPRRGGRSQELSADVMPNANDETAAAEPRQQVGGCEYMRALNNIHQNTVRILDEVPDKTAEKVSEKIKRTTGAIVPPKGRGGRPRQNDHFVDYFKAERRRFLKAEKTNEAIFLAYKTEHPEQKICQGKSQPNYLNACRAALNERRKTL